MKINNNKYQDENKNNKKIMIISKAKYQRSD